MLEASYDQLRWKKKKPTVPEYYVMNTQFIGCAHRR